MGKWYEIWAAGNYQPQGDFTENDVQQIVDNYRPEDYEAPIVIGHPKKEDAAFGWVEAVKREGRKLLAKFKQVEPNFQEAVNAGRYKKVSVRIRKTDDGWTLRHVGFLGAVPPAVSGLKPIQFSEESSDIDCEFTISKEEIPLNEKEIRAEERKKVEQEFSGVTDENAKLKEELAQERRKSQVLEFSGFIDQNKEKLPPAVRTGLADFMASLAAQEEANIEFSDGKETKKQNLLDYFKDFVSKLPDQKVFNEYQDDDNNNPGTGKDFNGISVDEDRLALHNKALDFAEKNKCSYEEALVKVSN